MISFFDLPLESWTAIALSMRIALVATLMALPFAIAIAWLLARIQFPGKMIVDALIHLPLVIPPVVTGYLLLLAFGRQGWIGAALHEIGITVAFRWTGAALACGIMAFPLIVRPIRLSFETLDRRYEAAAATLGASPFRVFLTICLPLALPGIISGIMLGFARALGEFGATITFVSNIPGETQTIASAIYVLIQSPGGESAALTLTLISILLAFMALIASDALARRAAKRVRGE